MKKVQFVHCISKAEVGEDFTRLIITYSGGREEALVWSNPQKEWVTSSIKTGLCMYCSIIDEWEE